MTVIPNVIALFLMTLSGFAEPPEGFLRESIGSNWTNPVGVVERFDGHHVVWERGGRLWLVEPDGTVKPEPWLDISEEVGAWRDHGLLGFALHPAFEQTGWIYLYYVVDRHHLLYAGTLDYVSTHNEYFAATIARVTRYTATAADGFETIDPHSRRVLLGETPQTGIPILFESHAVGSLVFGQDGTLLLSMGDTASYVEVDPGGSFEGSYIETALEEGILTSNEDVGAYRAQMIDSLCGKILRLDAGTGDGVESNPYYDPENPRAARSRVWALGLRNPFRFTLMPETGSHDAADGDPGTLVVGDVGWYWKEEVTLLETGGLNCGWPIYEGLDLAPGYAEVSPGNLEAPNPLGNAETCEDYFSFRDLLIQDTQHPDPVHLNPCAVHEAEDAEYAGPDFATAEYGYLGAGYLDFHNSSADYIRWTITVEKTATYDLIFRYALRDGPGRPLRLDVDGTTLISALSFDSTGSFTEWRTRSTSVQLDAGTHTVSLHAIGFSGGNFDCLVVDDGSLDRAFEIPADVPVHVHHRPILDSQHYGAVERVPIYVGGAAANVEISSPSSPVDGVPTPSNSTIGGPFIGQDHDEGFVHDDWPEEWAGLIFADYAYHWVRVAQFDETGQMTAIRVFEDDLGGVVFLGASAEGDALLAVTWEGDVFRYEWAPGGNQAPTASFTASATYGPSPLRVTLDASGSSDPDEHSLSYTWDFGDGTHVDHEMVVEHVFDAGSTDPEQFLVRLTVEDLGGATNTTTSIISVNNTPPQVVITSPLEGSLYSMEEVSLIDLTAAIADAEHATEELTCAWTTILHHNDHTHSEPPDPACETRTRITPLGCEVETYWYELELRVTDGAGLSTTVSTNIFPDCKGGLECHGDLDLDGVVGPLDIAILLGDWLTPDSDINGDGTTGSVDLAIMLGSWGDCP